MCVGACIRTLYISVWRPENSLFCPYPTTVHPELFEAGSPTGLELTKQDRLAASTPQIVFL